MIAAMATLPSGDVEVTVRHALVQDLEQHGVAAGLWTTARPSPRIARGANAVS